MIANSIRRFIAHRDGAVGITFAVSLIALVPAVGTAIDYGRAVQFKTALQNAADNAALAGASAYISSSTASNAQAIAANYMNAAIALLPANNGVTSPTPTTNVLTSSGQTTGYTVTATASGSIATTFM